MNLFHKSTVGIFSLFCPCKIYGKKNVPQGGAVIVSNHFHALDCGFLARVYSKDVYFLAKKELFKNKLVAWLLKTYGGIPVDRQNPDMKSMLAAIKILKNDHKLVIFPEGTRNKTKTDELQEIKGGAIVFAVKAKKPIVPVMMSGKMKLFRRSHLIVGEPFELSEFYDKKLSEEDYNTMSEIVRQKMIEQQLKLKEIIASKKNK